MGFNGCQWILKEIIRRYVGSNRASDRTATIDAKPLRWIEGPLFNFLSDRYRIG
jgi:hypothetical protein